MDVDVGFMLREELAVHQGAVRSLCTTATGELISGGQDAVLNRWDVSQGTPTSSQFSPIFDHNHHIVSLTALAPGVCEECPAGGFVTGCMDQVIRVYSSEGTLVKQLVGHTGGVISLSWTQGEGVPRLISGSWSVLRPARTQPRPLPRHLACV